MSLNNVLSSNGVIKPNHMANVNSNVFSNPHSNINNLSSYNNQSSVDVNKYNINSINVEKTSLELSLNVLGIEHSAYENMSKHEFLYYYDNFKKQNSNINKILASKIALKYKLGNQNDIVSGQDYGNTINESNIYNQTKTNFYQPDKYEQQQTINQTFTPQFTNLQFDIPQIQINNQNLYQNSNSNLNYNQKQNQIQNQNQNQNQHYNTETNKTQYTKTTTNTNIQKSKQKEDLDNINQNFKQDFKQNFKPNFKPTQSNSQEQNKYLINNIPQPLMDKNNRDFDLNSIIDNYTKQKNSGAGKNLDVTFINRL
jgi:hypothetical protein